MSRNIVVVCLHPNIYNNPSLISLFYFASIKDFNIILLRRNLQQFSKPAYLDNVNEIYIDQTFGSDFGNLKKLFYFFKIIIKLISFNPKIIIGVDHWGIIIGSKIKKFYLRNIKLIYYSFEILFLDELKKNIEFFNVKKSEYLSSHQADYLIIQDRYRRAYLENENNLKFKKNYFYIPVAGINVNISFKDIKLSYIKMLKIPENRITIIFAGSINTSTGLQYIIDFVLQNKNLVFWFIIHDRIGFSESKKELNELQHLISLGYPISLSKMKFEDQNEFHEFLISFDIGFALYQATYDNPYLGKNLEELGLSSGKSSTFLNLGMPLIFSSSNALRNINREIPFGYCLEDYDSFNSLMDDINLNNLDLLRRGAKLVFNKYLDPDIYINNFLNQIN